MTLSPSSLIRTLTRPRSEGASREAPPRLLLVDDEPSIRAFLMRAMSLVECEVVVAGNGPEAIVLYERTPSIDLLLSDLMMPGMNGLELGRRLQRLTPDLKVLYLTGYSDALFEERPILGANEAFVDKPITPRGLHEAISQALFGHLNGLTRRERTVKPVRAPLAAPAGAGDQQTAWI
jgi:CheY-like chemotaxis protein